MVLYLFVYCRPTYGKELVASLVLFLFSLTHLLELKLIPITAEHRMGGAGE